MNTRRYLIGLIFLLLAGQSVATTKSDQAKEKRWEDQIVPSLMVGDAVKLKAAGTEFLALYAPNTDKHLYGGVILLHGIGAHPAWPQIIEPLRIALPDHGWSTLSLQMPILPNEANLQDYLPLMPEAPARIQAGVDYLKRKGIKNIVIVAHSMGTTMANVYLANKPDKDVHAYVAIGMSNPFPKQYDNAKALRKINLPMLDLYGSQDLETVLTFAKARAESARRVNKRYTQLQVLGADHFFTDMQDDLVRRVRGWLIKNASGIKPKSP
jgi:pimeloyl-ACP methyl ester carboxylesterase